MTVLCTDIGERHIGSSGQRAAADYIEKQFAEYGYDVVREHFDAPGWEYGEYRLSIRSTATELPCFPCYYSNACDVHGKIRLLKAAEIGALSESDVNGRILLYLPPAEGCDVYSRNQVAELLDRLGAAAMIAISNYRDTVNTKIVRTPKLKHLAVMCVSVRTAVEIVQHRERVFRLEISAKNFPAQAANLVARVQGTNDRKVIVGGHYDTAPGQQGALDNASGISALLEISRLLRRNTGGYSVDFVAFDAEEYGGPGFGLGSYRYVQQHTDELKHMAWMCNFDGLGFYLGEPCVAVGRSVEIQNRLSELADRFGLRVDDFQGSSDEKIFDHHGIPTMWFYTERGYSAYHSPEDTIDSINFEAAARITEAGFVTCQELMLQNGSK